MTHVYDIFQSDRNIKTAVDEWESGIEFGTGSNTYKLVRALLEQADRIDEDLEDVYEAHHINSAEGTELDRWGDLVNIDRETGESDDSYRARIKARTRAATIDTTYNEFYQFCLGVLDTAGANVELFHNYELRPATIDVAADPSVWGSLNVSASTMKRLLAEGVPAGHRVRIRELGTFRLKTDGQLDDPDKGLTSDSISTGGTLAADVI